MAVPFYNSYNLWADITKSDTVNFDGSTYSATPTVKPRPCDAIYVGGAGTVIAVMENGTAITFTAVAGAILPLRAIRVNNSSAATGMVALYYV